ncbi:N-substituted formamide deformylase [Bdellovibrio bacteriovorus]|uniref:amidohydrolase n=1 Tax=Bdellovibrio bacteriovorus TaxID=959 RepID=UPI00045BFDB7|nr:amidohydrolase [Bdellovibrio bacteriovorus]AHZ83864.1 amidohydrolase [Bdellovibrio bacteriovorus]BEV69838.1 N-substituted formamide deformylase [Bdellovibrio bacteriovorus]
MDQKASLVFINGKISTMNPTQQDATAVAVLGDKILSVGSDKDVMKNAAADAKVVDLQGRRLIPGLIDSHIHVIRGGLNYNMELRWDGVDSLAVALRMLKEQAQRTPAPQWVRVVGGFTEFQFREKRLPTIQEINEASPDTPVFILHLYDRALLNAAAVRVCGFTKDSPNPPGGEIQRDANGNPTGILIAKPNALILYSTLAKGPKLPVEYQKNSTQHFMRELNRLGVTGVIDAGGGFQNYPDDYTVIDELAKEKKLTLRIAYNLFTQKPKGELADFKNWTETVKFGQGDDFYKHNGAGEMLVYSAADFEDFREPRPDMPENMEEDLEAVVRVLVEKRWPFRMHATYNETIERALNVFEKVNRDMPFNGIHWFFDHAETISEKNIERVKALNGGIAVQHRMAYQGEYFVNRYGNEAVMRTPPVQEMLKAGVPVGAGTDATRVASYNPWMSLYWLTTGKTVGGLKMYPDERCLDRAEALKLWTISNTWFSNEDGTRGQIVPGQLADFVALSADYFTVPVEDIKDLQAVMTVVGGNVVYGAEEFKSLSPEIPAAMPDWSPVRTYGGYQERSSASKHALASIHNAFNHGCCGVHAQTKKVRSSLEEVALDWSMGCSCWAF